MQTANLISLIALGLVFVLWAGLMFHLFWRLTRRSLERHRQSGGGYFDWAAQNKAVFKAFSTSPQDRTARNRLYLVTLILFAIIILRAYLLPAASQT